MVSMSRTLSVFLAGCLVASTAAPARAHCCHDTRLLGVRQLSEFRRGVHGMNDGGITDSAIQAEPPSVGRGLGGRDDRNEGVGGFGQLHGNSIGNYGAGSLGDPGPGGLGAMKTFGLGAPPRPR